MKKEKVIAVRLTQEQWEILEWARVNLLGDENKTMSRFVLGLLKPDMDVQSRLRAQALRREETAAKRKAPREAKKVAQ
jgi:hypothetical protein